MAQQGKPVITIQRRFTVAERRRIISQLYLTGRHTLESITEELNERYNIDVSISTVSRDLEYHKVMAQLTATRSISEWIKIELEKLDALEDMITAANMPSAFHAKGNDLDLVETLATVEREHVGDMNKAAEILLKIADRRTKLLGLDAPKKVAIEGGDPNKPIRTSEVSDEELEAILKGTGKVQ